MSDSEFVQVEYTSANTGEHGVVGPVTKINYGYHRGGELLPNVHIKDVQAAPHLFRVVAASVPVAPAPMSAPAEAKAPKRIGEALTDDLRKKIEELREQQFVVSDEAAETDEEPAPKTAAKRGRKPKQG